MMSVEDRLKAIGLALPQPRGPLGAYVPSVRVGELLFSAGQVSSGADRDYKGKLGRDLSLEEGQRAAQVALLNALAIIKAELGSLDHVRRVVRLNGYVNSAPGFTQQPQVLNGASDLLVALFGDQGRHARVAVGVSELPLNAAVEVELIVEIRD